MLSRKEISYGIGAMISTIGFQVVHKLIALPYMGWQLYGVIVSLASGSIVGLIAGDALCWVRYAEGTDTNKREEQDLLVIRDMITRITNTPPRGTITWN